MAPVTPAASTTRHRWSPRSSRSRSRLPSITGAVGRRARGEGVSRH
jgi:hypothetical protein